MAQRAAPVITVEISEILGIGEKEMCVVSKKSGRVLHLPLDHVIAVPHAVMIPEWLAKKLRRKQQE